MIEGWEIAPKIDSDKLLLSKIDRNREFP
jgi:hypothetical protein